MIFDLLDDVPEIFTGDGDFLDEMAGLRDWKPIELENDDETFNL